MRMQPAFGSSRSRSVIENESGTTRIYTAGRLPQIVLVHLAGLVRLRSELRRVSAEDARLGIHPPSSRRGELDTARRARPACPPRVDRLAAWAAIGATLMVAVGFAFMAVEAYPADRSPGLAPGGDPPHGVRRRQPCDSLSGALRLSSSSGAWPLMLAAEYRPRGLVLVSTAVWVSVGVAGTGAYLLSTLDAGTRWAFAMLLGASVVVAVLVRAPPAPATREPRALRSAGRVGPEASCPSRRRSAWSEACSRCGLRSSRSPSGTPSSTTSASRATGSPPFPGFHTPPDRRWVRSSRTTTRRSSRRSASRSRARFTSASARSRGSSHRLRRSRSWLSFAPWGRPRSSPGWAGPMFLLGSTFFVAYGAWPTAYMLMTVLIVLAVARLVVERRLTLATALCIGLVAETGLIGVVFALVVLVAYLRSRARGGARSAVAGRRVRSAPPGGVGCRRGSASGRPARGRRRRERTTDGRHALPVADLARRRASSAVALLERHPARDPRQLVRPVRRRRSEVPQAARRDRRVGPPRSRGYRSAGADRRRLRSLPTLGAAVRSSRARPRSPEPSLVFVVLELVWLRYFVPMSAAAAVGLGVAMGALRERRRPGRADRVLGGRCRRLPERGQRRRVRPRRPERPHLHGEDRITEWSGIRRSKQQARPQTADRTDGSSTETIRAPGTTSTARCSRRRRRHVRHPELLLALRPAPPAGRLGGCRDHGNHGSGGRATAEEPRHRCRIRPVVVLGAGRSPPPARRSISGGVWVGAPALRALRVYLPDSNVTYPSVLYTVGSTPSFRRRVGSLLGSPAFSVGGPLDSKEDRPRRFAVSGPLGGPLHWRIAAPVTERGGPSIRLTTGTSRLAGLRLRAEGPHPRQPGSVRRLRPRRTHGRGKAPST